MSGYFYLFQTPGEGTEDVNLLASSALVGHLNGMKANGINIINAAVLARDAGLVTSARHICSPKDLSLREDLDRLLQLTVTRDSYSIHLIGMTFLNSIQL
jgi:hypothetical protein